MYRLTGVSEAATRAARMAVSRVCALSVVLVTLLVGLVSVAIAEPLRETAYKEALAGNSAAQILRAAFPTGAITKVRSRTIRVLVADLAPSVVIEGQTALTVVDQGRTAPTETVPAHQQIQITPIISGGVMVGQTVTELDTSPQRSVRMTGPVLVSSTSSLLMPQPLALPGQLTVPRFRGALQIRAGLKPDNTTLTVVNDVSVQGYVEGVLAGQMPSTWGPKAAQALVAGAIAVRSRAIAGIKPGARSFYDVTTDNPLYLGIDGERTTTDLAAAKSVGEVLAHKGKVMNIGFVGIAPIVFAPSPGHPDFVANGPPKPIAGANPNEAITAIALAKSMLKAKVRYVYGGDTPTAGFDCSGLMYWVWHTKLGLAIPRVANSQSKVGYPVQRNNLQPGDLVFFADSSGYVTHVGLYIGDLKFLAAADPALGIRIDSLTESYYAETYAGARRFSLAN